MDPRLIDIFTRQQASGFPGLAGSETYATVRISAPLLNEVLATALASVAAVREISVQPRAGNRLDVRLKLTKPAFLPTLSLTLAIERQPKLPADPVLVLKLSGAAGMIRVAAPAIAGFGILPPGVRLEGDHIFVDLRTLLQQHGQARLLEVVEELEILTDEARLVLLVHARVPAA